MVSFDAATDPGAFAEQVLGQPLWPYQLEFARSKARYRFVCAGRQVGKSTALATIALFEAATRANILVLVVSAGEDAAKRVLADCVGFASHSAILSSSTVDEGKSLLSLINGSRIVSVPASIKQIRGNPVDLLILDEAAFISNEIWESAEPSILARPGSRVIATSSPWGSMEHWFRRGWNLGKDSRDAWYESWQWRSSDSPLADAELLQRIQAANGDDYFNREYNGEFQDDSGSYFTERELESAVADYSMTAPEDLDWFLDGRYPAAGGVDWGLNDANVLALVSPLEDYGLNRKILGDHIPFFIPWYISGHKWPYSQFIDEIVRTAGFYHMPVIAAETNGVGQYPTTMLDEKIRLKHKVSAVAPVNTDAKRKQSGFGMIKGLLQTQRLVLPRDPEMLKQLRSLEVSYTAQGTMQIRVPERAGHDDVAMALMQAVSAVAPERAVRPPAGFGQVVPVPADLELVETKSGLVVPAVPRPMSFMRHVFSYPRGSESGEGW
jgi:hypothetical protein